MKKILQIIMTLLTFIIMIAVGVFIWVSYKPINLGFAENYLEEMVSDDQYTIDLERPKIISNKDVRLLGIHLDKVTVKSLKDHQSYTVENITLDISKNSLFKGEIGLNKVIIDQLDITKFNFVPQAKVSKEKETVESNQIYAQINEALALPILEPLKNITVRNSNSAFHLEGTDIKLVTHELQFKRLKQKTSLEIKAEILDSHLGTSDIHLELGYHPKDTVIKMDILKMATPQGSLTGNAVINKEGDFTFDLLPLNIYDGMAYKTPTKLSAIKGRGHWNDLDHKVIIEAADFEFKDKVSIFAQASLDYKNGLDYDLEALINNLTLKTLLKLWPKIAASGARDWVEENMTSASFDTSKFKIAGHIDKEPRHISLEAPITNAAFSFLKPMTPANQVTGKLLIEDKKFTAKVSSGKIGDLNVKSAEFIIPDMLADIPMGYVKANINGKLKDILLTIDQKPLNLMQKGGFGYQQSTGYFSGNLAMDLPLLKNTKLSDINIDTQVNVKDGSLKVGGKPIPLEKINADLSLTASNAKGSGSVWVYGVKSKFDWKENFNLKSPVTTDLKLKTYINDTQIQNLVAKFSSEPLKIRDYAKGSAYMASHIQLQQSTVKKLNVNANLKKMAFGTSQDIWHLPKDSKKTLTINAAQKGSDFNIQKLVVNNPDLHISLADLSLGKNGLKNLKINHLSFKDIIQKLHGHYHIADGRHMLKASAQKISVPALIEAQPDKEAVKSKLYQKKTEYPNMMLSLKSNTLLLTEDKKISKANILIARHIQDPHQLTIDLDAPGFDILTAKIHETGSNARNILIKTKNAGKLLSHTKVFDRFENGSLDVNITQQNDITKGTIIIKEGRILKAPWIAKLLSVASLEGILDRLNNRGLSIDRIKVNFHKQNGVVSIDDGLMNGSAIGLSFQGKYTMDNETVDIFGTVIPFYGLNSILSEIPIIGAITSSREGEGIMGLSYKIQGPAENTEISVNPLSILSPGILRRIFE